MTAAPDTVAEPDPVIRAGRVLDLTTAADFRDYARSVAAGEPTEIIVDLSATQFLDTVGVAAVVAACRYAKEHDLPFSVVGATGLVLERLQLAKLTTLLNVREEEPAHA